MSVCARALLVIAVATAAGACRSTGAVPRPFPMPGTLTPSTPPSTAPSPPRLVVDREALTSTALSLRGKQYRNGGADPDGFDCSGFTQYVFAQYGIPLPREVKEQFEIGIDVKAGELAPGDLVFFTTVAPGASHVGIALGADRFVHAPSSSGVVRVEQASAAYWSRRFVGARRIAS